jgi:hypothetical protein
MVSANMRETVAVVAQDPGRLRRLWRLLVAAELPVVAAVMPESGGLGGMRAFLARHKAGVVVYDVVPGADGLPGDAAAVRFFHQVQAHEPRRRFVVLARTPLAMLAGAGPSNIAAVLAADPSSAEILAAVRRACAGPSRRAGPRDEHAWARAAQRVSA